MHVRTAADDDVRAKSIIIVIGKLLSRVRQNDDVINFDQGNRNTKEEEVIHLSLLIMSRKYLLLCPAYWTRWEQHGELRSPCNSGVRAFGPIKQLGDSDSIYIALQYRHSKCYPLRLHSITIDLYTVTGQDRDGQLNFDHLYSMYMYVFVSNIYI